MKMKFKEAREKALAAGASEADIAKYAKGNYGGPAMKRAMIAALQMHSWHNGAQDWARLAGALAPKGKFA